MKHLTPTREASCAGTTLHRKPHRLVLWLVMAFFAVIAALALLASPAKAANFTVTNTKDSGAGSLRDAIEKANNNGQSDTITFDLPDNSTITLTSGQLTIEDDTEGLDLSIVGPGPDKLAVSGNDQYRVFTIAGSNPLLGFEPSAEAKIEGLTITKGRYIAFDASGSTSGGGGIQNRGTLTLENCFVSGNETRGFGSAQSAGGGGIFSNGFSNGDALTLINTTVSGNNAEFSGGGGGILSGTPLTLINTTVSGNTANSTGGGIYNVGDKLTLTNSTVSKNSARRGGGLINDNGLAVIENSTITNNAAPEGQGSGVFSRGNSQTRTEVRATIISGNKNTDVDSGSSTNSFQSEGSNLIGNGNATGAFDKPGDKTNVSDPRLGLLADNGGPTKTHGLSEGSPAIDAVVPPAGTVGAAAVEEPCEATEDQRGVSRPRDGDEDGTAKCDIGSFELMAGEVIEYAPPGTDPPPPIPPPTSLRPTFPDLTACDDGIDNDGDGKVDLEDPGCSSPTDDSEKNPKPKPPKKNPRACTIKGNAKNNVLRGTPGRDVICGFGGNDTIRGLGGNDLIKGGAGNDIIFGQRGNDRLLGGGGNDVLYGGAGRDRLLGQRGKDALFGGRGRDVLLGGPGKDVLNGGRGKDVERGGLKPSKAGQQAKNLVQRILKRAGF